ncbi:potassium-transporting ATPase subunit KdpA [Microvirga lotononidis]|uniref:Potassium-transporting ATPase potassium-binding subunit n=1 Tax=Microvirga lotononidis TaxID=864069 RepID=I4YPU4_9HYPH|nr:potassium-transporting ATPase subunit KdpA [Microvirga lotononidis]EIM25986.1 K+-transporting ATPase, KdpA [Microvirga lotononidis]WQO25895.1 potassium-transporting ATPase subunit KdpA [Microvirga lotononidis]
MTLNGWLQIAIVLATVLLAAVPLGTFMAKVYAGKGTFLSPVLGPVERGFYALAGIDPAREQGWRAYALAMLLFNAAGFVLLYALLRLQGFLPLNPQGFGALSPDLAFNTAVSFVTNTNWQSYGGETTMSHFSQMAGLTVQNFLSAATGLALAVALVRGFARSKAGTVGNFWVDMTRSTLYVLLPLSLVTAILLVALGIPQTMLASVDATTLEGAKQTIALGPVASQIAIKQLGTNGGGFFNVNAAHPFENPTALANVVQVWQMLVISVAVVFTFGRLVGDSRQARALVWVMGVLLVAGIAATYAAEAAGTPVLHLAGIDLADGNMEGKEVRFGLALSALWAVVTTGLSCGAVNAMHASFTPIGGMIPMFLMQLGEILPGGVGSGLYGILVMAIIAVFVAGLMVGRTPEYLGKKIEAKEVKMAMLAVLILPTAILGFSAVAAVLPQGLAGLLNAGPHGLSEILYAYSSAAGNNGSAFAGLTANSPWYNTTLGLAMLLGRFAYIVPMLAIAGSLAAKTRLEASTGTFPTHGPLFVGLLTGMILILGGLQFFPAPALGPIAEQVLMLAGKTF